MTAPNSTPVDQKKATSEDYYFDPKARYTYHEEMIKDPVRQGKLTKCIEKNADKFKGATVLVVGCGLGLTSLQCARIGGAKRVVGVEHSSIIHKAREVAEENGLDGVCEFYKEEMEDLPIEKGSVDIIICEWVGNVLSNEPAAKELIKARDLYLAKNGTIVPDRAAFHITACCDAEYKHDTLEYWENVYGFRMCPMKKLVYECPIVSAVPASQIVTNAAVVFTLDAYTMKEEDLNPEKEFTLLSSKNGEYIHYLIGYVTFGLAKEGWKKGFNVHAGPNEDVSYWQQTCFTLEEDLAINYGDKMKGCFKMTTGKQRCEISIDIMIDGSAQETNYTQKFVFFNA